MSDQNPDTYLHQVQQRTQDLLSGCRPRDSYLSSLGTKRLILEAIVEEVKIYRLHKEEEMNKEKDHRKRRGSRKHEHEVKHRRSHDCRDRSPDREDERHHRRRRSKSRERNRSRVKQKSQEGHRTRKGNHRQRRRDVSQGRHQHKRRTEHIPDPVIEGPPDPNPEYMVSGGAGPPGTLLSSEENTANRNRSSAPTPGRVGASFSPTRRTGPDGKTPFGKLPEKASGVGLVKHFIATYKHIKAEHEAGHRSRGALEKTVDGWMGRKSEAKSLRAGASTELRKLQKSRRGKEELGNQSNQGHERQERGRRREVVLRKPLPSTAQITNVPEFNHEPQRIIRDQTPYSRDRRSSERLADEYREVLPQDARPPSTPDPLIPLAQENTPILRMPEPHVPLSSPSPAFQLPGQENISPETPVLRESPARTPQVHQGGLVRAPFLHEIEAQKKLRKVKSLEKKPKRDTPAYEETLHSHHVEEREREQVDESSWSDAGSTEQDDQNDPLLKEAPRNELEEQHGGGGSSLPEQSSNLATKSLVIPDAVCSERAESRNELPEDTQVPGEIPVSQSTSKVCGTQSAASFNEDGIFSNLAAHVGTPSWNWDNLDKRSREK